MRLIEDPARSEALLARLCGVWERSVRATHLFLTEAEIQRIAVGVPAALGDVPCLVVVGSLEEPVGFLGIGEKKLEMLFLAPEARGRGLGRGLVRYGVARHGIEEVCVNQQNPQAVGFYERLGFRTFRRTETDEQGGPYPLLYMRLSPCAAGALTNTKRSAIESAGE